MKNRYIIGGIAALCAAAVIIGIIVYRKNHLSADDVGVTALMNEKIVSARYETSFLIEEFNYDCENLEETTDLLNTVKKADFRETARPTSKGKDTNVSHAYNWQIVRGETDNGSFAFGRCCDTFVVCFNDEYKYYKCSALDDYNQKLWEIQKPRLSSAFED